MIDPAPEPARRLSLHVAAVRQLRMMFETVVIGSVQARLSFLHQPVLIWPSSFQKD